MKYAEHKILCNCIDVSEISEGNEFDRRYEVLSTLKNKKIKMNNMLIEKYKDMLEKPDFEQDYWSKTAIGIYKITYDSVRSLKWLAYCDRNFMKVLILSI